MMNTDLDYLYNRADADLGFKSNCIESCLGITHLPISHYFGFATYKGLMPFSKTQIRACRRLSRIKQKLAQMSQQDRRMLDALFCNDYHYPPELAILGKQFPLVLFYPGLTLEELLKACRHKTALLSQLKVYIKQEYERLQGQWQ